MPVNKFTASWVDKYNRTTISSIYVDSATLVADAGVSSLRDALAGCSNAKLLKHCIHYEHTNDTSPHVAASNGFDALDEIRMKFLTAAGDALFFDAPDTTDSLLSADETLITSTSGAGKNLKDGLIGVLCDAAGQAAAEYVGCKRIRAKRQIPLLTA